MSTGLHVASPPPVGRPRQSAERDILNTDEAPPTGVAYQREAIRRYEDLYSPREPALTAGFSRVWAPFIRKAPQNSTSKPKARPFRPFRPLHPPVPASRAHPKACKPPKFTNQRRSRAPFVRKAHQSSAFKPKARPFRPLHLGSAPKLPPTISTHTSCLARSGYYLQFPQRRLS